MARSVFIDLIGRDRVSPAMDTAAASAERAAGKMTSASARMARTGAAMTKAITVPLLAVAAVSVKTAVDYQKSMTLLQTAGGESARKMAVINKGIQDVAVKTGTSLKDLTDGMYIVAKAGSQKWSAAGQLNVLRAAAEGAKAENVDLATATNALTSVMMSYHLGASQAVAVQNMLVVGAGRAKTTMQQYAGALSTVVPVASAAHISFQQVAGAIATMTQHGTSADEATQELSHTIRNLLSPNQVAQKAMQQLGLSVVDITKNLGKRGLTGTIDLITNAIAKHMGPAGMVAVSAFKRSQSASADLNVELSHMPKNLAAISTQFSTGKMSYKDYYKAVKDLGGQAFTLGKNFLTTYQQAHGFNDLLKNGSPQARTFAGTLKNVMGTATGMNTALQLGGENMAYFKTATADVGKAAHATQGDVLGWAKTQDTLAVKMDKAKASLQVLGLEIGNALIPAVSGIVKGISSLVTWFSHLSGTQKTILMWSLGVLAALGPILSIQARLSTVFAAIGRFVAGVSTRLATLAGASEVQAARFSLAMTGITAGIAGVGLGIAVGSFARNSSTTVKWLSALGSAAAGAAIGFSIGGPMGAAIGGVAGGVSALATSFIGMGHKADAASQTARQALADQQQAASDLLSVLKQVSGAYTSQYRAQIVQSLQKHTEGGKNAYDNAQTAGIGANTVTQAAMGQSAAIAAINARIKQLQAGYTTIDAYGDKVTRYNTRALAAASGLASSLSIISPAARRAEQQFEQFKSGMNETVVPTRTLAGGISNLSKELGPYGRSLSSATAFGARNIEIIKENATQLHSAARAQLEHGKSAATATGWLRSQLAVMRMTLGSLGFSKAATDKLITSMHLFDDIQPRPKKIDVNNAPATSKLKNTGAALAAVNRMHANPVITATGHALEYIDMLKSSLNSMPTEKVINIITRTGTVKARAAGGGAPEGWFWTGERGPELVRKDGSAVHVFSNPQSRALAPSLGTRVPGFASGTANTSAIGSAIGNIGSGYTKTIDLNSVGITRIWAQIQTAWRVLNGQIANGLSSAAAANFRREIESLTAEARTQLAALKTHIAHSDFGGFIHALTLTVTETRAAFSTLMGDARRAGASQTVLDNITKGETRLLAVQTQRNTVTGQLTRAQAALTAVQAKYSQVWTTSRDASMGSFDITTAGGSQFTDRPGTTAGSILASLRATAAKAGQFRTVLARLVKEGLNRNLVAQLAAAGPGALAQAQALAASTPAQMRSLNTAYSGLSVTSSAIGKLAATDMYGAGVQSAQGLVNGLRSRQTVLNAAIARIANGMIAQLKKTLGIHSPSRVMYGLAGHTVEGYRRGIVDRLDDVRRAGKDMGNAAVPGSQAASWSAGQGRPAEIHIHGIDDPQSVATAVMRRMALPGYGSA